ncbi:hypothetical protein AUR04nite_27890 [Glutamicibacter uratoxydans]|uniref:Uncharacterized protein n=1 Tax=Glutamicibacter uratoxydans TaxID=43667 RepID=A0A4Y4DRK9_GLUUR|nr:ROK family transcriptional regulator [Glutamicibacter uratoxydans]GED07257.1 hypothetical protein AUR04nite_27890 [Glutamicibacter uratoxydans]
MSLQLPGARALATVTDAKVFALLGTGPATRTEISVQLGISKPTASQAILRLQQFGLVSEGKSSAQGKRGRIPERYELRQDYGHVLAVELSAQQLVIQAEDLVGQELARFSAQIDSQTTQQQVLDTAGRLLTELDAAVRSPRLAVGISQAAPVMHDEQGGVRVIGTPIFAASDADIASLFDAEISLLDNDVNWMAVAEYGQRQGSMLLVYLGAGIGAALMIDGALHRGRYGVAGELENQKLGDATLLEHLERGGLVGQRILFEKLADPESRRALVEPLGAVLGNLVGFLDPEAVVVTGPGASEELAAELGQAVEQAVPLVHSQFQYSQHGGDGALAGAMAGARSSALETLWKQYREV